MDPLDMTSEDRRILGIIEPLDQEYQDQELLDLLADQIEFDDERGLKFKKTPWTQAQWDEWNANLHPSLVLPTVLETPRSKSSNKCPIPTAKGNRCLNNREPGRPACHIHDPESAYAKQYPKHRKKMIAELKRLGIA